MLSKIFSQLTAKVTVQAWAMLVAGVVFGVACRVENPVASSERSGEPKPNQNPKVTAVTAHPASLASSQSSTITVTASDPDHDELSYSYSATGGAISGSGKTATFVAGSTTGSAYVTVTVNDGRGGVAGGYVVITIR